MNSPDPNEGNEKQKGRRRTAWGALATLQRDFFHVLFRRRKDVDLESADGDTRRRELTRAAMRQSAGLGRARVASLFVGKSRGQKMREEAAARAASELALTMGQMKGLAMKFGQFYSFAGGLSKQAGKNLEHLQSAAPPMDFEIVRAVLEAELGARAMRQFASFDEEPLAAASVGQVHRAVLPDGRAVVVKVQYPGIEEAILNDFDSIATLTRAFGVARVDFDMEAILDDLLQMMKEEFDYEKEAANQTYFAERFAQHPYVKIAEVVPELSTQRVLTSEWIEGRPLSAILETEDEQARDGFAEIVYRFAFDSLRAGVFTTDPHPGNYLFLEDGRVCFLDFGFVKRLDDAAEAERVLAPILATLAGDGEALAASLRGLGLVPDGRAARPERLWAELQPLYCGPIDRDEAVRLDRDEFDKAVRLAQRPTAEFYRCRKASNQPTYVSMLLRYTMGIQAVLALLGASANWRRLVRELLLDEPPQTEIGRRWGERRQANGGVAATGGVS